jgi:hypothetical protein
VPKRQHGPGGDRERQNPDGDGNNGDLSHSTGTTPAFVGFVLSTNRRRACRRSLLRPIDIRDPTQITAPGC